MACGLEWSMAGMRLVLATAVGIPSDIIDALRHEPTSAVAPAAQFAEKRRWRRSLWVTTRRQQRGKVFCGLGGCAAVSGLCRTVEKFRRRALQPLTANTCAVICRAGRSGTADALFPAELGASRAG